MAAQQREGVRQRIHREMYERGWNVVDLAREADLDPGTVGDFLAGPRWPQKSTQAKLSRAFGWEPDGLERLVADLEPVSASETVAGPAQDAGVLLSLPPGVLDDLSPADREEAISAAKATLLERAREIRRRLDS